MQAGPPDAAVLLRNIALDQPLAILLAGHNGSGKTTLWNNRFSDALRIPLINADRLTLSILPEPVGNPPRLPAWAADFRDNDQRWQRLSQAAVAAFVDRVVKQHVSFAYETVFSFFQEMPDGQIRSKGELIAEFKAAGYSVALLFVGLASAGLSALRVNTRRAQGGHAVPEDKLIGRFPRTQKAIRLAAPAADLTLMFDNSRGIDRAFALVRAQAGSTVLYDCRTSADSSDADLVAVSTSWLNIVAPAVE